MTLEILLVEDNPADAYLVKHALKRWKTPYRLHAVDTAEDALDFINRRNGHANSPTPHLALVDINLPKEPGFTVLEAIKGDPRLRGIAVVVMSSSVSRADLSRAVELHTNAYIPKSWEWAEIERIFESLEAFWRLDVRFSV